MPNKTIYVRDEDLQVYEDAEKLGGDSLSSVIAEALRRFVDVKRAEAQGMDEHHLEVGIFRGSGTSDLRRVRFVGRQLAAGGKYSGQTSSGDDRGVVYGIYQTRAGKILIWWKHWSRWENENDTADYAVKDALPGYDDEVWGKALDSPMDIPGSLLQEAAEALGQELVEYVE